MTTPLEIAREAWGDALPDWIEAMALECMATSQAKVAKRMNRSAAAISTLLRAKYGADLSNMEEMFRGAFQQVCVECPALGALPSNECQEWRRKSQTYAAGNPHRVRMYRACGACPRNRKAEDATAHPPTARDILKTLKDI